MSSSYELLEIAKDLARLDGEILLAHVLDRDRVYLLANQDERVSEEQVANFSDLVEKRRSGAPIAHLIGKKPFYRDEFFVNDHTLIPRPASEDVVEAAREAIHHAQKRAPEQPIVVIDVGTGSGAIGLSVAKGFSGIDLWLSDFSQEALEVAIRNATALEIPHVHTACGDLLRPWVDLVRTASPETTWIVVANLPYLSVTNKKTIMKDVVDFEPHSALFSGPDGLDAFFRFLIDWRELFAGQRVHSFCELEPSQMAKASQMATRFLPQVVARTFPKKPYLLELSV